MPRLLIAIGLLAIALPGELLAQGKGIRLWNLTAQTISAFELSPAGKNTWGPNQTLNDKDKEVDHDERLRITGITSGRYDVKFTDKAGRRCTVRNVEVQDGAVFSIEEKQLADCGK